MKTNKNSLHILESARALLDKGYTNDKSSNYNSAPHSNKKLSLTNHEIVKIKEFMHNSNINKDYKHIQSQKLSLISNNLLHPNEIEDIQTIGELLQKLHMLRKRLKEDKETQVSINSSQDFLSNSSKYTTNSLCTEFSCSFEQINSKFVEEKRDLCCSKLKLLLSQQEYCEKLFENIEGSLQNNSIKIRKDIPDVSNMGFDDISRISEDLINKQHPDFSHSRILMEGLINYSSKLIKDVDNCCLKIDLANKFLSTAEKSRSFGFNK